jgi:hypothetical protein
VDVTHFLPRASADCAQKKNSLNRRGPYEILTHNLLGFRRAGHDFAESIWLVSLSSIEASAARTLLTNNVC